MDGSGCNEYGGVAAFLEASITNLPTIDPDVPVYARPIGQNFDSEWVKAAKEAKRREMTRPPPGVQLSGVLWFEHVARLA
jgi:hypothetical protein